MAFSAQIALTLARISELAYSPSDKVSEGIKELKIRNSEMLSGAKDIAFLKASNRRADTECYLLLSNRKDIVIAFRGSEWFDEDGGFKDWIRTDLDIVPVAYPLDKNDPGFLGKNEQFVHHGFWEAYKVIRTQLLRTTLLLYKRGHGKKRHIYVTGHSLGGALAVHAGMELSQIFDLPVKVYTFGSPRVGNHTFANAFNANVSEAYLFAQKHDPIPFVPPLLLNIHITNRHYKHPRQIKYIDKHYKLKNKLPVIEPIPNFEDHAVKSYIESLETVFS